MLDARPRIANVLRDAASGGDILDMLPRTQKGAEEALGDARETSFDAAERRRQMPVARKLCMLRSLARRKFANGLFVNGKSQRDAGNGR